MDITSKSIDKMPIYQALGVPEVWRYDLEGLHCLHLIRGKYQQRPASRAFPFLQISNLQPFLDLMETTDQTTIVRQWRRWVNDKYADKL
jgi:Uma2 family endonuclease